MIGIGRFGRGVSRALLSGLVLFAAGLLGAPGTAVAQTTGVGTHVERGYIAMADGTKLHYHVELPETGKRLPAMLNYTYYAPGVPVTRTGDGSGVSGNELLKRGYALVGVTVRGTGCSEGTFDDIFDPQWSADGYEVVEWIARQPWSNGKVGMYGLSGPGILQWMVAGAQPPHLTAIAPFSTLADLYRDVGAPGGIKNVVFAGVFLGAQNGLAALNQAANPGDPACLVNGVDNASESPTNSALYQMLLDDEFDFDTPWMQLHHVKRYFEKVRVPTLTFHQWQDEQLPARVVRELGRLPRATTWSIAGNGNHSFPNCGECLDLAYRFIDHFMKGEPNGFERTPHYQIWHENTRTGPTADAAGKSWATSYASWPPKIRPLELFLREDDRLSFHEPKGDERAQSYAYPLPASSRENTSGAAWRAGAAPGGALSWTSTPFGRDRVLFSAGLDLWLASTATDTDVQATLTEIRPDGQEVYLQRGWLRASHRALDPQRSTATQPEHPHQAADLSPLEPGKPTFMRIGFFDISAPIRKGSRVRVYVEAPVGLTGGWQFLFNPTVASNTVFHDARHPSKLVLGVLPGEAAQAPLPPCEALVNMPCRPNRIALPVAEPEPASPASTVSPHNAEE
jgi:putative CocE/NonD family hydrolase